MGTPLWGSSIEMIINKSCIDVPKFYAERRRPDAKTEEDILVATIDGKGVVMRKDQIAKTTPKNQLRKMRKIGERKKKPDGITNKEKLGKQPLWIANPEWLLYTVLFTLPRTLHLFLVFYIFPCTFSR